MIDALSAYRNSGIDVINDVMRTTVNDELKIHTVNYQEVKEFSEMARFRSKLVNN